MTAANFAALIYAIFFLFSRNVDLIKNFRNQKFLSYNFSCYQLLSQLFSPFYSAFEVGKNLQLQFISWLFI